MQQIWLSGGPVTYLQRGTGFPLLLLHGWGGSANYWQQTLAAFGAMQACYAPDLPGYGFSPPWDTTPSIQQAATIVIAFAEQLGLERFDLVAHSFTTSVAAFVAVQAPHRVRRLVLTCASTYRNEAERQLVRLVHQLLWLWLVLRHPALARNRWLCRAIVKRFFYRLLPDDHLLQALMLDFLRMDRRTAIAHAQDVVRVAFHDALQHIAAPTLIIGARQDQIMPPSGTFHVAQLIPQSRLTWIERCGHLPMLERPAVYHRLLHDFLATEVAYA